MARIKKTPFPPWLSRAPDGIEKRYIRLANTQLLSKAMQSLGHLSFRIFVNMVLESGGRREFEFPYHKYKSFCSKDGFSKALGELTKKGFVEIKEHNKNRCKPNIYRFSEEWKKWLP